jgi:hypothetical protein
MKTEHDQVKDLAMLVKRMATYAPPGLRADAIGYLKRYNLEGTPLRQNVGGLDCGVDLRTGKGICVCGRCSTSQREVSNVPV